MKNISITALCENFLLDHNVISTLVGITVYVPLMFFLFILFVIQSIVSILLYSIDCCSAHTNTLRNNKKEEYKITRVHETENINKPCQVSILQYNTFAYFGRFWIRQPLMKNIIKSLSPDIICINEAIRSRIWSFGTLNMIQNIFKSDGFISSPYDNLKNDIPFLFKYSIIWDYFIAELQLLLNIHFILPFLRSYLWIIVMKVVDFLFLFSGAPLHFGNALVFTNNVMYDKDILILPGVRTVNRCLYIHPENNHKKLWILNTHLTARAEAKVNVQKQQLEQCQIMFKWMEDVISNEGIDADAIIICGDFNS
eukprot:457093_1